MGNTVYIAGNLTAADWHSRATELRASPTKKLWEKTFDEFFRQRLELRYLDPIELLQSEGTYQGEGFTIVSIQCALIEFLAASREGLSYSRRAPTEFEYSKSGELFERFLSSVAPFNAWFSEDIAHQFYVNVRCGLLHEASTKGGWRIWASGPAPIDAEKLTVYRNQMHDAILEYIDSYGALVAVDPLFQAAFLRKFDSLASATSLVA